MSPSNTFDKVKTLKQNKDLANEKAKTFCYHYEPKWYDHGHFARCQVQAKSIYIKKARRAIVMKQNLRFRLVLRRLAES